MNNSSSLYSSLSRQSAVSLCSIDFLLSSLPWRDISGGVNSDHFIFSIITTFPNVDRYSNFPDSRNSNCFTTNWRRCVVKVMPCLTVRVSLLLTRPRFTDTDSSLFYWYWLVLVLPILIRSCLYIHGEWGGGGGVRGVCVCFRVCVWLSCVCGCGCECGGWVGGWGGGVTVSHALESFGLTRRKRGQSISAGSAGRVITESTPTVVVYCCLPPTRTSTSKWYDVTGATQAERWVRHVLTSLRFGCRSVSLLPG